MTCSGAGQLDGPSVGSGGNLLKRVSYPLLGLLVCLQVLERFPATDFSDPGNVALDRIKLKSGSTLTVDYDITFPKIDYETPPLYQRIYGANCLAIQYQRISFLGEFGSVVYLRYLTVQEAREAARRIEESWDFDQPMRLRLFGRSLVRFTSEEISFPDFSRAVLNQIQENFEADTNHR